MADIAACRLSAEELAANFADANPPLTAAQAAVEAQRCFFCHDAPCIKACPTGIDIPSFIGKIATGNLRGSALTILEANILGGSCARVCPTEELCEQACVRDAQEGQPLKIGLLQRHSTDWLMERATTPFARAPATGHRIAVVGAGPAGLACAHGLARYGHEVTIFEAKHRAGGLNEFGIAAYKLTDDFAQRELQFVLGIGGISIEYEQALGRDFTLDTLRRQFDAVFLGLGQAVAQGLGLRGEQAAGIRNAVDFIADIRQRPRAEVAVGRRVVVIGGGNTAIDAAVQARLLGAEEVTIVYRRGPEHMSATLEERRWAQTNDVLIRLWATPVRLSVAEGTVAGVEFARTRLDAAGRLIHSGEEFHVPADMVLKAIGQRGLLDPLGGALALNGDRIAVDSDQATSLPGVYAGGDCVPGTDLTVSAVEDGKRAAEAIHRRLSA
ncbi:MAG: NAD(P)-dependent oxidoreductase [Steroidobacteraceae bacterium]